MEVGYDFYPLEIGHYVVYDVDSLIYDDLLRAVLPSKCQLRYEVVDTFRNNNNELAYVVNIRYRKTEAEAYVPYDVMYVTRNDNRLIETQNNMNFIKLTFPIQNGNIWDGNAMIPHGDPAYAEFDNNEWNYTYSGFNDSYNTGINLFQHTVKVHQIDDQLNDPDIDSTAYAYRNFGEEVYAFNVGMVYRERIYWVFQPRATQGQGGGSGYRKGYSVIMKAVEYN